MKVIAEACGSSANVGPGFDVFGIALDAFKDRVEIELGSDYFIVEGKYSNEVPHEIENNLIGAILDSYRKKAGASLSLGIRLVKGVPTSLGLGSSGASSAAFAAALLYAGGQHPIDVRSVLELASFGEAYVTGSPHMDNLTASVLGGFTIASKHYDPIRIDPPNWIRILLLIPNKKRVVKDKTRYARSLLKECYPLEDYVFGIEHATTLVKGFLEGDINLIRRGLRDVVATPYRKQLIEGYETIAKAVEESPAIGCFISGAGPSIAVLTMVQDVDHVHKQLRDVFLENNLDYNIVESGIGEGVRVWVEK